MRGGKFLKNKKVLITSWSYAELGGATLNAVELAEQLIEFGATIDFFSYDIDGPFTEYINKKFNTNIISDKINYLTEDADKLTVSDLDIDNYDYVWVGSNTIPISIIRQINSAKRLPKFIFVHMSALVAYPLEAPLMLDFEKKISSKVLSISQDTTVKAIQRIFGEDFPVGEWPNPVPSGFRQVEDRGGVLRRVAVISSSHPSEEVLNIKDAMNNQGIEVDYIGGYKNNTKRVDADLYSKYDLIVGIGKDARYSLVSGVPIYVYGRFGGPGYLDDINYQRAVDNNLSGRGFSKKTSQQIYDEIIAGYSSALGFHQKNKALFAESFSIDYVASRLFRELEKKEPKNIKLKKEELNWLVTMQIVIMQRVQTERVLKIVKSQLAQEKEEVNKRDEEITYMSERIEEFTGISRSIRLVAGNIKRKIKDL